MSRKPTATDLFDPAILRAKEEAKLAITMAEDALVANGAEKIASWVFEMTPEATLESLKRFVNPLAYGKAFGDGQVFAAIPDTRVTEVSFFKFEDGSGIQIAKHDEPSEAMKIMLGKLSMPDLDLMPKMPKPKEKKAEVKEGKLTINGSELTLHIAEPAAPRDQAAVAVRHVPQEALGGLTRVPPHNPVAMKAFLTDVWTAQQQAVPMHDASHMAMAAIMAATSQAHPSDDAWPEGIKVKDAATGEYFSSPRKAMMVFDAAVSGEKAPVMDESDVMAQFKASRGPKM